MLLSAPNALWAVALSALFCSGTHARVTKIVIDGTQAVPVAAGSTAGIAYEQVAGRAFGELDLKLPQNAIIQDIELAKDADGKVREMRAFFGPGNMIAK